MCCVLHLGVWAFVVIFSRFGHTRRERWTLAVDVHKLTTTQWHIQKKVYLTFQWKTNEHTKGISTYKRQLIYEDEWLGNEWTPTPSLLLLLLSSSSHTHTHKHTINQLTKLTTTNNKSNRYSKFISFYKSSVTCAILMW